MEESNTSLTGPTSLAGEFNAIEDGGEEDGEFTVGPGASFGRQKSIFSSSLLKNVGDDKNMTPEIWKSHRRTLSKAASVKNYDMISEMQQQVINAKKSVALNPESEFAETLKKESAETPHEFGDKTMAEVEDELHACKQELAALKKDKIDMEKLKQEVEETKIKNAELQEAHDKTQAQLRNVREELSSIEKNAFDINDMSTEEQSHTKTDEQHNTENEQDEEEEEEEEGSEDDDLVEDSEPKPEVEMEDEGMKEEHEEHVEKMKEHLDEMTETLERDHSNVQLEVNQMDPNLEITLRNRIDKLEQERNEYEEKLKNLEREKTSDVKMDNGGESDALISKKLENMSNTINSLI
eukprot:UN01919